MSSQLLENLNFCVLISGAVRSCPRPVKCDPWISVFTNWDLNQENYNLKTTESLKGIKMEYFIRDSNNWSSFGEGTISG